MQSCSRLIKNAVQENETVGLFYALRASANHDKASNCRDARKARALIKDPSLTGSINTLEKNNCGNMAVSSGGKCMSDRSSAETARGNLEILSAQDAAGRPQTAYILKLQSTACLLAEDPMDNVESTRTVHIFGMNDAVHARIASFVGRTVVVTGRAFPALTPEAAEGWIDHIQAIPGQLIAIIREDPAVLDSCANYSVALVGPP